MTGIEDLQGKLFRDKFLEDEEILKILQVEFGTKVNVKVIVE